MKGIGFGLDIGGTKTLGVAVDADGVIVGQVQERTVPGERGLVETAARVLDALCSSVGVWPDRSIGIGIPGLVDTTSGAVKHAVNLGIDGYWFPIGPLLQARLGLPVIVENDVKAGGLGAVALTGAMNLAYLSIGTGLAASVVVDGRVLRGVAGAAGEIGHIPIDPGGQVCRCGQRGCLETVASGAALATLWPSADRPAAADLFAAAEAGDSRALAVRRDFVTGLACAVRVLSLTVDAPIIVLGGGVSQLGEPLSAAIASVLDEQAESSEFLRSLDVARRLQVVPASYPISAIGATRLTAGTDRAGALTHPQITEVR